MCRCHLERVLISGSKTWGKVAKLGMASAVFSGVMQCWPHLCSGEESVAWSLQGLQSPAMLDGSVNQYSACACVHSITHIMKIPKLCPRQKNTQQTCMVPEVGMWLPVGWLSNHVCQNLTNRVTLTVLAGEWRIRKRNELNNSNIINATSDAIHSLCSQWWV